MDNDFKPTRQAEAVTLTDSANLNNPLTTPVIQPGATSPRLHKRVHWWLKSLSKRQFNLVVVGFFLVSALSGYAIWQWGQPQSKALPAAITAVPEKPKTVASRLTGRQVSPELNELPVTGVMIENSPDARPQSGLYQADMVFEAISEGGITRFLALYQESQPGYIGPVRSVRPYYLDMVVPYQASIAHAGGSGAAISQIRRQGIRDLDHGANGATYQRVSNRYAPHNLYTSRGKLLALQRSKGYKKSSYTGFLRKDEETPAKKVTAATIDLDISTFLYNPQFVYNSKTNSYKRSIGGKPHVDERTGRQISPKVVVAIVTSHRYNGIYSVYRMTGSGKATIFQDGKAIQATWSKASRKREFVFKDSTGKVIPLNPGQTWLSLVKSTSAIHYKAAKTSKS